MQRIKSTREHPSVLKVKDRRWSRKEANKLRWGSRDPRSEVCMAVRTGERLALASE